MSPKVLKGDYNDATEYSAGDVVRWNSDTIYVCHTTPPSAGIPPTDTQYFERYPQPGDEIIYMMIDALANVASDIPNNIDNNSISLQTETGEYLITVDDSGDTPELDVTAVDDDSSADDVN